MTVDASVSGQWTVLPPGLTIADSACRTLPLSRKERPACPFRIRSTSLCSRPRWTFACLERAGSVAHETDHPES